MMEAARENAVSEAGGRHGTESSKKMRAPDLHVRDNHGQILQYRMRGYGKDAGY
jgi:hypothetical protein